MDYTKINLEAGNIIDITSSTYGWTAKEFRIMRVREIEGDDGSLRLEFACTEYDDTIYDGTWANFLVAGTPGIRSIGAIGTPGNVTANVISINAIPSMQVTSTIPSGIVDRMQFWAGNVLVTGNASNTAFNLVGSVASTDANAFVTGNTVTFSTNSLTDGTYVWKARGVNINGTGPYSNVSGNVVFASGNALANAAASSTAVTDSATSGPIFRAQLTQGYQYSVSAGKLTTIIGQSANVSDFKLIGTSVFTVPSSIGNVMGYKIDTVFDQNSSGADGGRGNVAPNFYGEPEDRIGVNTNLFEYTGNIVGNIISSEGSGGRGAMFWDDFALVGFGNLTPGNQYAIQFSGLNYTQSNSSANCNISVGWNVYTNNNAGF
jgi:hypothetical protein